MNSQLAPLLTDVAKLVLSELANITRRRYSIKIKSDGSPVTEADVYVEEKLRDFLTSQIPGLVFIGEESWEGGRQAIGEWRAVLDPIDGTENFCSGLKEWGTSLSIWKNDVHAGSLLMLPELGESMTSGIIPKIPHSRIVGFSSSYHEGIGNGIAENLESRIMGCAVYNLYNVIRGSYCRFLNPKGARSWDLLAGVALAREAGCEVIINDRVYDGRFLEPDYRYRVDIRHRYDLHTRQGAVSE